MVVVVMVGVGVTLPTKATQARGGQSLTGNAKLSESGQCKPSNDLEKAQAQATRFKNQSQEMAIVYCFFVLTPTSKLQWLVIDFKLKKWLAGR